MRIRFLRGYRGRFTDEAYYDAGEIADIPQGAAIVAEGAAEPTPEEAALVEPEPEPEPAAEKPTKKAK